jgi:hypothetical protein
MLKKSKQEVINSILSATYNITEPACSAGWPPYLTAYVKELVECVAITIVDNIYTEKELDAKIEDTLLK